MSEKSSTQVAPGQPACGKFVAVILSLREEDTIACVVEDVRRHHPTADVLVVDGESNDRTAARARAAGAWVIGVPESLGIAGAMETALQFVVEHGYRHVVRLDADGQHTASDSSTLLGAVVEGKADLAIGSRFVALSGPYDASAARSLGISFLARLVSLVIGQPIKDPTSGLQAMTAAAARHLTTIDGFEYSEIEAIVALARAGYRIREFPVAMKARQGGRSSFTAARAFYYMFLGVVSALTGVLRRPARITANDR